MLQLMKSKKLIESSHYNITPKTTQERKSKSENNSMK